ncbi:iron complex outermembrane recepter protein [Duganella sp. CF402]|uniref:TonB-dependent receptor n=1 Tax=unclassified Duganella TaxID=2636909 RepID=UPI0008B91DCA|nr:MULTISPECIES: TonB-dependent receptor [unclassified Duganella]RZT09157.1 iron complex outermembrane receptor protein [Duganella sp. BK701]SEL68383.1 iron complex outermembrane recepter protein [Duganella sp. CF402]
MNTNCLQQRPIARAIQLLLVGYCLNAAAQTDDQLETVIIKARRVAESSSTVPLAVTAISNDELKTRGVVSVADIGNVAPGVVMGRDGFGVNINIRGVTTTDTTSKGLPGVSFNVDDVAISRPVAQGLSFFDIDHVEVLRGPQGTLYGKSTTGGAVNVITARPQFDDAASAQLELGNYNTRRLEGMVNKELSDSVAIRVAANSNDRDGYLQPAGGGEARNDQKDRAVRLSALFKLAPATNLLLSTTAATVSGIGFSTVPGIADADNKSGKDQLRVFANPFGGKIDEDYHRYNGEFNTELNGVAMTYVASFSKFTSNDRSSSTYDPATNGNQYAWRLYRGNVKENSHELRFAVTNPQALSWVAGLNYSDETVNESDHYLNAPVATPTVAASVNGIDPVNTTEHKSSGVFGQATYALNSRWSVLLGARRSKDTTDRVGTFAAGPVPTCTNALEDCIGGANNGHQSASVNTYRAGLNFQMTPEQLLFGAIATGYKPGGFNDFDPVAHGTAPYEPEKLTAYELGYKGRLAPNLQFNSDLYYYDYAKDQISSLANIAGNFVIYTRSVPATIYGWENELTYKPGAQDTVRASLVFAHSEYKRFKAGLMQNVDWAGKSLDKTPSSVVTLSWNHNWPLADGGRIRTTVGTRYSASYLVSDFVGAVQYKQKAFSRTDLSASYTTADGRYTVQAYVNNLEDKVQITAVGGNNDYSVSAPRFYGVRLSAQF